MSGKNIEEVIKEHADELMAIPGVVGVGEGKSRGKQCIVIFVLDKKADSLRVLPDSIAGYLLTIKESGEFQALDKQ